MNRVVDADHEWTEWHHYVFVKDKGHKSIWIDGVLFHEGDNSLVLPSDFDFLYIGGNQTGANSTSGIIDDFAVFASALTEEQIIALAEGNTDILPEKREIEVPLPDIPILLSKSPTGAAAEGEETEISLSFRGIDFTDLSITVNDTAVDPTITSEGAFTTITANGAFSLNKNVITVSWNGESETWNYFQFSVAEGQTGLASYSVETVGAVPGPWAFEDGVWVSAGSVAGCGGPYHDFLTSPDYTVSADGEVTLSFEHRHAFEGAMWDSGQLWISVNGDAYADVGTDAFTANGYTDIAIIGNGIAKGQNGFGNTSAGYADGSYITTTASLGSFDAGDAISVRFVALYDDCATGTNPNWVIASVSSDQMAIKLIEGGLVAHWPMNEGSGDVFKDVVGGFDGF
ncbi:MAG TPA: LamG domain-containing protein, partial [Gammaproteobacteria bacterium]|nr:LamG domain-containing protein [Gammaproteobacteria bacterium]